MRWRPTARTHAAAVIGSPVRHSLSPVIHNAAFRALELDWVYLAHEVPAGGGAAAVEAMRALALGGLNVTMPLKDEVAAAVDRLSPAAEALGAVNTVVWQGDRLFGENTDGSGFIDALRVDEAFDPAGARCVVLGAGGAARAVVHALAVAAAGEVVVVNRTERRGRRAVELAPRTGRVGDIGDVARADLLVNATPVGMRSTAGEGALPVAPDSLRPGMLVVDLVYEPLVTPLLDAAREAGAVAVSGLGMLVHQAAHAFRLFTGEQPPVEVMSAAAVAELTARQGTSESD
jgi:shikimate dehydrogenase